METNVNQLRIFSIERPDPKLLKYYILVSLLSGPALPIVILPLFFKYHTLRYKFDEEGISMRWGILFRREVILNYSRIQDIHLTSNIVERWLGLARVQIQTASGSSSAEMTIEGLLEFEAIRDFLYSKMRGLKEHRSGQSSSPVEQKCADSSVMVSEAALADVASTLTQVADELKALRQELGQKRTDQKPSSHA